MGLISRNAVDNIKAIKFDTDKIIPSFINTKNPYHILIDGMYASSLLITGYNKEMEGGFLERILNTNIEMQLSMFYEKENTYEVIKNITYCIGSSGAEIKLTNQNQMDVDTLKTSYDDAKYIRKQLQIGGEELYDIYIYITLYNEKLEELEYNLQKLEGIIFGCGLEVRRASYRQEQAFISSLPILDNDKGLKDITKRNVLTKDLISTYPFMTNELCDRDGIVIGKNLFDNAVVMLDRFDTTKYKNANVLILGSSGSGKSYFTKLMIIRNRYLNIEQYIIDPDMEYLELCNSLSGTLIRFDDTHSINVMDIRQSTIEEDENYLKNKLSKLNTFFSIIFKGITEEELALLEEKAIQCYENKGITFDNETLYKKSENTFIAESTFKESVDMPTFSDLYNIVKHDKKLKKISNLMKTFISGSLKSLSNTTNIDIKNKLVIADIHNIEEKDVPVVMFILTEFFWDKIKIDRSKKKVIYLDEAWKMIGSDDKSANFLFKIFKTIRKYGGAATVITQDVNDFFMLGDGKFGKGIINNTNIRCVFSIEEGELRTLKDLLELSEEEYLKLQKFNRGQCLLSAGGNRVLINIEATNQEHKMITTDRADIERLNGGNIDEKNYNSFGKFNIK